MFNVSDYLTSNVKNSVQYAQSFKDVSVCAVRLNSNENQHPFPDVVVQGISAINFSRQNYYPHETSIELRKLAAQVYGGTPNGIAIGIGSSELLSYLFRIFLDTGEYAAMPSPGFTYNRMLASLQGGYLKEIQWQDGYQLPVDELVNSGAKFIIIVNPNNPSGTTIDHAHIKEVLRRFNGPVVVDEAYIDFCGESCIPYLGEYKNLIVLRTMSKAYSAAGIRVGFCFASEEITTEINKIRSLFCTNTPSELIASVILNNHSAFEKTFSQINHDVKLAHHQLEIRGFNVIPTKTNFILAKVPMGTDAAFIKDFLQSKNYLVRLYNDKELDGYLRVSIGTESQMKGFFSALDDGLASPVGQACPSAT